MNSNDLNINYSEISGNLAERKLKPAFDFLEKIIVENRLELFHEEWQNLEQTYRFMLKYTVEGINDPERQVIYRKLFVSVYELTDKIFAAALLKVSSTIEHERIRTSQFYKIAEPSGFLARLEDYYLQSELVSLAGDVDIKITSKLESSNEHHKRMVAFFNHVWLTDRFSDEDYELVKNFFGSELISETYKAFMVSALNLSLLRYFDERKFVLLYDVQQMAQVQLNQRALIGLLLAFYKYDSRLPFYPDITGRLIILNEDPDFKRNLERVIIQLIRSRETEKIQKRIREEIIPEMIRISPNLKDKINLEGLMGEGTDDDKNPDWQELFKDSPGLVDKMEEFSELQLEGADVFMGSFAMLKMYPFFGEFTNWFIPFFKENPAISYLAQNPDDITSHLLDIIDSAPILCNSDKYSFCLSIDNLPKENREFIAQGMNAEISQLIELQKDEEITDPGKLRGIVSNQYIQDLYRFYKLHPRKNDFEDIFKWRFDFHNKISIGDILREDEKVLKNIAEYLFKKNYYSEAAEIFNDLLSIERNGEMYQKVGYCLQKSGDFNGALEAYQKAELFDMNKVWLYNKIAFCYRNLKKPKKALEYYLELERNEPENLNNELNIGHCYLELEEFEMALKCYFKVEYLAPENKKVWRPLGWCSFVTGKKEQALKYFQLIVEDDPGKHDLMNMGHVQWSLGNRKAALEYYKRSITPKLFTETEFFNIFGEDLHHLLKQGIDKDDVPIMLDQLRYFVEE